MRLFCPHVHAQSLLLNQALLKSQAQSNGVLATQLEWNDSLYSLCLNEEDHTHKPLHRSMYIKKLYLLFPAGL